MRTRSSGLSTMARNTEATMLHKQTFLRNRTGIAVVSFTMAASSMAGPPPTRPAPPRVVFACEHGTVKSVIAAYWFNRLAAERKAPFRAVSRGIAPDAAIPPGVAAGLAADGFDVAGFRPLPLVAADVTGAAQVVAIGADSPLLAASRAPVARWDDIPPASVDYAASRDAMRARMGLLLDALAKRPPSAKRKAAPKGRPGTSVG